MPDADVSINEIKALEDRRYRAMIDGNTHVLDELCSDDLIYTHSKGDHNDKARIVTFNAGMTNHCRQLHYGTAWR